MAPDLSERVDWAVRRAMSPNPEHRPTTCREFVADLIGRSTRPSQQSVRAPGEAEVWYLTYLDEFGHSHTVKGEREGIRRALRDGLLGDTSTMTAARNKQGPFQELRFYPEFRDLLIAPEALPTVKQPAPTRPVTRLPATPAPPPAEKERKPPAQRQAKPAWRQPTALNRTPPPA